MANTCRTRTRIHVSSFPEQVHFCSFLCPNTKLYFCDAVHACMQIYFLKINQIKYTVPSLFICIISSFKMCFIQHLKVVCENQNYILAFQAQRKSIIFFGFNVKSKISNLIFSFWPDFPRSSNIVFSYSHEFSCLLAFLLIFKDTKLIFKLFLKFSSLPNYHSLPQQVFLYFSVIIYQVLGQLYLRLV